MNLIRALIPVLALAACSSAPQWEKAGASQAQLDEDLQQCRVKSALAPEPRVSSLSPSGMGTPAMERAEQRDAKEAVFFDKCMQDKGYRAKR